MKTPFVFLCLLAITISCSSSEDIDGYWSVKNDFYKATYLIDEFNNKKKALVVSYNDGTTAYTKDSKPNQFLFQNLKKKDGGYVDAVSGATKTSDKQTLNRIDPVSKDTLEVTTYISGKPLKEHWIRTTKSIK